MGFIDDLNKSAKSKAQVLEETERKRVLKEIDEQVKKDKEIEKYNKKLIEIAEGVIPVIKKLCIKGAENALYTEHKGKDYSKEIFGSIETAKCQKSVDEVYCSLKVSLYVEEKYGLFKNKVKFAPVNICTEDFNSYEYYNIVCYNSNYSYEREWIEKTMKQHDKILRDKAFASYLESHIDNFIAKGNPIGANGKIELFFSVSF